MPSAAMPKAAVNKDSYLQLLKHKVGMAEHGTMTSPSYYSVLTKDCHQSKLS